MGKLFFTVVASMAALGAEAQMLSVNTDVLMDVLQTPSAGAELVVSERSTVGLNVFGNHSPWGKDMKIIGVQPEYRYYFSGRPMHKHFVGVGGVGVAYDISWKGKIYDGGAFGLGLTFGYVFNVTRRVCVDCHLGLGVIAYKHKEYFENDNYDADYVVDGVLWTNARGYCLLPTRIGVSVSYILR